MTSLEQLEKFDHLIKRLPGACIEETLVINPYSVKELCADERELGLLKGLLSFALNRFVEKIRQQPLGMEDRNL